MDPIYFADDRLDRITETLVRMNGHLECLRVTLANLAETAQDHEDRVRSIERWKHTLTPILATGTFLLGATFSIALEKFL
ncbi:MAG: hypothetical protein KDA69_08825 [Planctomycetaceae bacterium]|nr:hypothetical protein [Planctomycetaceae bacterium]MCA9044410.1 hypothetical protein [Planctomycetaceae bacterium]MCB9953444.1 hypothetical protein [Planctomycetaceae bacterium]